MLSDIMKRNGSDKSGGHHTYTDVYTELFEPIRMNNLQIFELGLGTNNTDVPSNMGPNGVPGASLRGWREYFPNSLIYGADIDKRILFTEDRIQTFYCDQTSAQSIRDMWSTLPLFDIIIEDGLHTFEANKCFFENSIYMLQKGGYFIIEDIDNNILHKFDSVLEEWKGVYPYLDFNFPILEPCNNKNDNRLLVIKDTRS